MNASDALNLLNQSLIDHKLNHWNGGLDNARRRFGVCRMSRKQISLSRHLCELNSDAEVRDTILHEIAHALAWERHGVNCGHDKRWQAICIEIGARPVACFDDDVIQPTAPWVLVNRETGEVYRSYYKRPSRDWSQVWIRGQKAQTHGKLEVRANTMKSKTGDLFSSNEAPDTSGTTPTNHNTTSPKAITQFTAQSAGQVIDQLLADVNNLAKQYGLKMSKSKASYSEIDCNLTLTLSVPNNETPEEREFKQRIEFDALASLFGLTTDHYQHKFTSNGEVFKLIGFKPKNRKYPIIGINKAGKRYKFEAAVLDTIEV